MKNKLTFALLLLLCLTDGIYGQQEEEEKMWAVNSATLFGGGYYSAKDNYLSPYKYVGWGAKVLSEQIGMTSMAKHKISRQQLINVDFFYIQNGAETTKEIGGMVDYTHGYHYHFQPLPKFKILAGLSARGLLGFIYNTRNGNNPASVKIDTDLNLSAIAIYHLNIRNYPLTVRYQLEVPFAGVFFAPKYGQSYYEIFNLGNTDGIINFSSFHNKLFVRSLLTVDLSLRSAMIRFGYMTNFYHTKINGLETQLLSRSFMIGMVKELHIFGGEKQKRLDKYQSVFY